MTVHRFSPKRFVSTIGPHAPLLRISDGYSVVAATIDAHGLDAHKVQVGQDPNPMTGPFFIEGAAHDDTLAVTTDMIEMNRRQGWTQQGLAHNVVDQDKVASRRLREKILWDIDRNGQRVSLRSALPKPRSWSVPLEPMIGCLGVAPDGGQFISTATSGLFGDNMDYCVIRAGTTICFPVSKPGARFFLWDVRAAQGDGEIAGTVIATSAEVQFTVRLLKGKVQVWPRGEDADAIFTIGNARPLY